jgi:hypothetical protein
MLMGPERGNWKHILLVDVWHGFMNIEYVKVIFKYLEKFYNDDMLRVYLFFVGAETKLCLLGVLIFFKKSLKNIFKFYIKAHQKFNHFFWFGYFSNFYLNIFKESKVEPKRVIFHSMIF